jgi:hypothetical protein
LQITCCLHQILSKDLKYWCSAFRDFLIYPKTSPPRYSTFPNDALDILRVPFLVIKNFIVPLNPDHPKNDTSNNTPTLWNCLSSIAAKMLHSNALEQCTWTCRIHKPIDNFVGKFPCSTDMNTTPKSLHNWFLLCPPPSLAALRLSAICFGSPCIHYDNFITNSPNEGGFFFAPLFVPSIHPSQLETRWQEISPPLFHHICLGLTGSQQFATQCKGAIKQVFPTFPHVSPKIKSIVPISLQYNQNFAFHRPLVWPRSPILMHAGENHWLLTHSINLCYSM